MVLERGLRLRGGRGRRSGRATASDAIGHTPGRPRVAAGVKPGESQVPPIEARRRGLRARGLRARDTRARELRTEELLTRELRRQELRTRASRTRQLLTQQLRAPGTYSHGSYGAARKRCPDSRQRPSNTRAIRPATASGKVPGIGVPGGGAGWKIAWNAEFEPAGEFHA